MLKSLQPPAVFAGHLPQDGTTEAGRLLRPPLGLLIFPAVGGSRCRPLWSHGVPSAPNHPKLDHFSIETHGGLGDPPFEKPPYLIDIDDRLTGC